MCSNEDVSHDFNNIETIAQVHFNSTSEDKVPQFETLANVATTSESDDIRNVSDTNIRVKNISLASKRQKIDALKYKSIGIKKKGVLSRNAAERLYQQLKKTPPVVTKNAFKPLLEDAEIELVDSETISTSPHIDTSTVRQEDSSINTQTNSRKSKLPPPIVITSKVDFFTLQRSFRGILQNLPEGKFSPVGLKLYLSSKEDFEKAQEYLLRNKYNFYTFPFGKPKIMKVVLKGLPNETTSEDILTELRTLDYPIESVRQLKKRVQDETTSLMKWVTMPLWVVTSYQIEDKPDIRQLHGLCHLRVEIEDYTTRQGPIQCYRCQGFGHKSQSCHVQPRCVKCGENHQSNTCTKSTHLPAKCANCLGDHPANFKQCPKYHAYVNGVKHKKSNAKRTIDYSTESFPSLPNNATVIEGFRRINSKPSSQARGNINSDETPSIGQIFHEIRECWNFFKNFNVSFYLKGIKEIFLKVKQQKDLFSKISVIMDGVSCLFENGTEQS